MSLLFVAHRLSCPTACEIFPVWGLNPCSLHGRWILNQWATKEFLNYFSFATFFGIILFFFKTSYVVRVRIILIFIFSNLRLQPLLLILLISIPFDFYIHVFIIIHVCFLISVLISSLTYDLCV